MTDSLINNYDQIKKKQLELKLRSEQEEQQEFVSSPSKQNTLINNEKNEGFEPFSRILTNLYWSDW